MTRASFLPTLAGWLLVLSSAVSTSAAGQAANVQTCPLIQPWTTPSGAIVSPRTASAVYQTLETRWAVDSTATRREITALLADQPALAHSLRNGAARCPRAGCSCPIPPRIAQTAQTAYSVPLAVGYRVDAAGTGAATALFLSRHMRLLINVSDSLSRSPRRRR